MLVCGLFYGAPPPTFGIPHVPALTIQEENKRLGHESGLEDEDIAWEIQS